MTGRGARLVAAAGLLAFGAAALAFAARWMPEGLAAACAPGLVLREMLAGLAVLVLLVGPAFSADDPERSPEEHTGLLAALTALPAAVALAASGGLAPADLLPAGALLLACDLAASSALRLDPRGERGPMVAGIAAALLAGIPVAAYGCAEFAGWAGAAAAFRISPLLAIRDVAGGWGAVAPAALLLVAIAAVLRFAAVLRKPPAAVAAVAVAVLLFAIPSARAEDPPGCKPDATVLVVGAPREGDYAALETALREKGLAVREVDVLPKTLPWETEILIFAREARSKDEQGDWVRAESDFCGMGGNVVRGPPQTPGYFYGGGPGSSSTPLGRMFGLGDPDLLKSLVRTRVCVPHPARRPEPGLNPGVVRLPFLGETKSIPGKTLAFLGVIAVAFVGMTLFARRRAFAGLRTGCALAGVAGVGAAMLFMPGILGEPFRLDRLVILEKSWGYAAGRRIEILRVERLRFGGADPVVGRDGRVSWAEIGYSADAMPSWRADGRIQLQNPGEFAILAGVGYAYVDLRKAGDATQEKTLVWIIRGWLGRTDPPYVAVPPLAVLQVNGSKAHFVSGGPAECSNLEAFAYLRRSSNGRVSRAGSLLEECLRLPPDPDPLEIVVPAEGFDADLLVTHLR